MIITNYSQNSIVYSVEDGEYLENVWAHDLAKRFKKTPHQWEAVHKSLEYDYRAYDKSSLQYSSRYNVLSCSKDGKYLFVKHEVLIPGLNRAASGGGIRAGILVEKKVKVVILFIGHHEDFYKLNKGNDLSCFKHLLKLYYPNYFQFFYT